MLFSPARLSHLFHQKLAYCPCDLYFVFPQQVTAVQLTRPVALPFDWSPLQQACRTIFGAGRKERILAVSAWDVVDRFGAELSISGLLRRPAVRVLRNDPTGNTYFALVASPDHLPLHELFSLLNRIQVQQGFLPIHASGVIHHQALYLFGGASGAGKSTIASLGRDDHDQVLDDDQVLLRRESPRRYTARSWSGSLQDSSAPLRVVFKLIQDSHTSMLPLDPLQTTRFLIERVFDLCPASLSPHLKVSLLSMVAALADAIPCYELHFQKSPDFWDVIETASIPSAGSRRRPD